MAANQSTDDAGSIRLKSAGTPPREIARGVYWLPIHGSNVYFIRSGSAWALIDTGWGGCAGRIRQAAETLFGANTRPAEILLTHDHPDHIGAAGELARLWECPVYLHADELPLAIAENLTTVEQYANPMDRWVILPLVRALPRRRYEAMLTRSSLKDVARALEPGWIVPGLPDWRWIPTPGHSPGHVAFFRESDRVLIAGDAVLTTALSSPRTWLLWVLRRNQTRVAASPWYTNWNQHMMSESVRTLARLEPRVLAAGHGMPMAGAATAAELRAFAATLAPGSMAVTTAHEET